MAATPKVYVICDQNCKFEGMTKEQILTAITQAVNEGTIGDIDTGFITTIKTINGLPLKFFVGEQSEYNKLTAEEKDGLFAIITNDTTKENLFSALKTLQTELSEIKAGLISGAFVVTKAKEAEFAKSIIPIDCTADDIKPTKTGLYAVTLANPRATVLLSITDLNKNTSASVEVNYGEYPTVPKLKTYIVQYIYGEIFLDSYAFLRSETTTFEKIQNDNSIESCYLIVPYGEGSGAADPTKYYSITTNLTNCYGITTGINIIAGGMYVNAIKPNDGFENLVINVTMGGVDVTGDCVTENGSFYNIVIATVTGDIVIIATATAIEDDNTGDDNTDEEENIDDIEVVALPAEYQQVAYIETDGYAYIDTGVLPETFDNYVINYEFVGKRNDIEASRKEYLFGCTDYIYNGSYYNHIGDMLFDHSDNTIYYEVGQTTDAAIYTPIPNIGEKFTITACGQVDAPLQSAYINNNEFTVNIATFNGGEQTKWRDAAIYLLSCNGADVTASDKFRGKLYNFKIQKSEYGNDTKTPIRDFVPCYRKSDNVIGLYDTVEGSFYTNIGSGAFTKGADIN